MGDAGHERAPDFGELLRRYRLAAGLSQEVLAERARLSPYGISALERGYRRTPQRETLEVLVGALALSDEDRQAFETAARAASARRRDGATIAVGPWLGARSVNLPLALTRFVGRGDQLDEIAALLRDHRFVTITGAGGVGKTQTALQAATAFSDRVDAVCFVNLAPIGDPSLVATAIASALGVQEVPNHPLLETLTAFLRSKTALLVLDNCEHVISEAATVVDTMLRACPNLRILATSRAPLRTAAERAYRLPSLDEDDAVVLFADRAEAADAHFRLTVENKPLVSELCTNLSGIPLAIELAAAHVTVLPLPMLLKALNDRFGVLVRGERTRPSRHKTMLAAIDWSYELLPEAEQQLFERLSIFAGGWTLTAAAAVGSGNSVTEAGVFELLSSLVDKSMVTVNVAAREPRYGLLEPFRQYAREKLAMRGTQDALAHRHARAYVNLAEGLRATLADREWVESARAEMENLRQALEFSLGQRSDILLGQTLAAALVYVWKELAPTEGRHWTTLALDLVGGETPPIVVADLCLADALIASRFDEHERELAASSKAFDTYRTLGDESGMVDAEARRIRALAALGRTVEANDAVTLLLARARKLGSHKRLSYTLRVGGLVSTLCGDFSKARTLLAEADAINRACGAELELARNRIDWAFCEFLSGDAELALEYITEGRRNARVIGGIALMIPYMFSISEALLSAGRYQRAETYERENLTTARDLGAEGFVLSALGKLAQIAAARSQATPQEPADTTRAARLLGFLSRRVSTSAPSSDLKKEYEETRELLRRTMGSDTLREVMSEGAALTENQIIELALS